VDQTDFAHMQACVTTQDQPQYDIGCVDARLDGDVDVDVDDMLVFESCASGPGIPAKADCPL